MLSKKQEDDDDLYVEEIEDDEEVDAPPLNINDSIRKTVPVIG